MSVRVRGLKDVQRQLRKSLKDVPDITEEMIVVMLAAISANTMPYVPVDTSALINSEQRWTRMTERGPYGVISYGGVGSSARGTPVQKYAIYVHEGPQKNWQKPTASNQYLAKGVRDFERDDLRRILNKFAENMVR